MISIMVTKRANMQIHVRMQLLVGRQQAQMQTHPTLWLLGDNSGSHFLAGKPEGRPVE